MLPWDLWVWVFFSFKLFLAKCCRYGNIDVVHNHLLACVKQKRGRGKIMVGCEKASPSLWVARPMFMGLALAY